MQQELKQLHDNIDRCKAQIASTYEDITPQNASDKAIMRQGFQRHLKKLLDDLDKKTNAIKVSGATVMRPDGSEPLFI